MRHRSTFLTSRLAPWAGVAAAVLLVALGWSGAVISTEAAGVQVEPALQKQLKLDETTGYIIELRQKADLSPAYTMNWEERGKFVYETLRDNAEKSQANLVKYLTEKGIKFQAFWIDNVIFVEKSNSVVVNDLQKMPEILSLKARQSVTLDPIIHGKAAPVVQAVQPNLIYVGADQVWAMGYRGQNIVVANIDTGARTTHEALKPHYRGWNGSTFNHDYNFRDPSSVCGGSPCDNNGHGSHTMGTMVGETADQSVQIGMAPAAKWIACKGCATNSCSDFDLTTCAQWIAAPTKYDGTVPDPNQRPHVVNNSWGGGGGNSWYQTYVDAWRAAGIYPSWSIGNAGSSCNTAGSPGDYGNNTASGAFDHTNGLIASFSSRGPGTFAAPPAEANGYPNLKPNVSAPGVNIYSSVGSGDTAYDGTYSGTSMASPHTSGLVALMWSACPTLIGNYAQTLLFIENTATKVVNTQCPTGGAPDGTINNVFGFGRINAKAAVDAVVAWCGPNGTLSGHVRDAAPPNNPIAGAVVTATGPTVAKGTQGVYTTTTAADGSYSFAHLQVGSYSVVATKFGYTDSAPATVTIVDAQTTVQDFALTAALGGAVDGYVTDLGMGWAVYSKIDIKLGSTTVKTMYVDPFNGYYSTDLPAGTYDFVVTPLLAGYAGQTKSVVLAPGDAKTISFQLQPTANCSAPGYGKSGIYMADFNLGQAGFTGNFVYGEPTSGPGPGKKVWATNLTGTYGSSSNMTLTSPTIDLSSIAPNAPTVEWSQFLITESGYDYAWIEVSKDNGTTWSSIYGPVSGSIDPAMTTHLLGLGNDYAVATFKIRFRFTSDSSVNYAGWYLGYVGVGSWIGTPVYNSGIRENFDASVSLPTGWAMVRVGGTSTTTAWTVVNSMTFPSGSPDTPPNVAKFNSFSVSTGNSARLYKTAGLNRTGQSDPLVFKMYHDTGYSTSNDTVQVQVSTDGGTTWQNQGAPFSRYSATNGWVQHSVPLSYTGGDTNVMIGFLATSAYGNNIYIDTVSIGNAPPPPPPPPSPLPCEPKFLAGMLGGFAKDIVLQPPVALNGVRISVLNGPQTMTAATPNDPNIGDGFYLMYVPIGPLQGPAQKAVTATFGNYAPVTKNIILTARTVNRLDFDLGAGKLTLTPEVKNVRLYPGGEQTEQFTLENSGLQPATYQYMVMPKSNVFVPVHPMNRGPARFVGETALARSTRGLPAGRWQRGKTLAAGDVLQSWPTTLTLAWGTGVDQVASEIWVSNPSAGGGDDKDYNFLPDGTKTGKTIPAVFGGSWAADMAFDPINGTMWQVNVGGDNCIYELNLGSLTPTGNKICPALAASERGLAYDPSSDTFFIGGWNTLTITRFERDGDIVQAQNVGLSIAGLAYNPSTGHLFVMTNATPNEVVVLDVNNSYAVVGQFSVAGFGDYSGAGLEFACDGSLWAANQTDGKMYQIDSGETGTCPWMGVPWFSIPEAQKSGTINAPESKIMDGTFIADGTPWFGLFRADLKVNNNTPYGTPGAAISLSKAFWDIPEGYWADAYINGFAGVRLTSGCGSGNYCPGLVVTRAQMAVFLERLYRGVGYFPPLPMGIFYDVDLSDFAWAAGYIEQLYNDGLTTGCTPAGAIPGKKYFCPDMATSRAQMAVFICRTAGWGPIDPLPPAPTFSDVPATFWAYAYIEQLVAKGVTGGCGGGMFCPEQDMTRDVMAVWVVRAFDIPYLH